MGYRGEIMLKYKVTTDAIPTVYQPGEACGQLVIVPVEILEPVFVEELSETERGTMGFGEADERFTLNTPIDQTSLNYEVHKTNVDEKVYEKTEE